MTTIHRNTCGVTIDGGVNVREDAVDWYLRTRLDLLKSILDGLDYNDSVGHYILAKENLENQGYDIVKGPDDFVCDIVAKEELHNLSIDPARNIRREARRAEREEMVKRGRERKEGPSYYSVGRLADLIPNHHWQGRFKESSVDDFLSSFF